MEVVGYGVGMIDGRVIVVVMFEKEEGLGLLVFDFVVFVIELLGYMFYGEVFEG